MSAMLANRRSMLYVGGLAASLLGILLWSSLANILFIRSDAMFSAELYMGLIAFSGFGKRNGNSKFNPGANKRTDLQSCTIRKGL